jgi:hypothetical protein
MEGGGVIFELLPRDDVEHKTVEPLSIVPCYVNACSALVECRDDFEEECPLCESHSVAIMAYTNANTAQFEECAKEMEGPTQDHRAFQLMIYLIDRCNSGDMMIPGINVLLSDGPRTSPRISRHVE